MPVDASIYSQLQAPDFLGNIQRGLSAKSMMDQQAQQKAQLAEEQTIKDLYKKNTMQAPDGSYQVNSKQLMGDLAQAGVSPEKIMGYQDRFSQQAAQKQEMDHKQKLERIDTIGRTAMSMKDPASYQKGIEYLKAQGIDTQEFPQQYDPRTVEMVTSRALSIKDQLAQQNSERDFGLKKTELGIRHAELAQKRQEESQKLQDKKQEKLAELAVPGYERTGEVMQRPADAQKIRNAVSDAEQLTSKLNRLKELVKSKGTYEYGGEGGAEMSSLATEIQLLAKGPNMYQLGVLTGPDMDLLNKITADPSSMDSFFTWDSTRLKQIETQLKSVKDKVGSITKASGYRKAGGEEFDQDVIDYANKHGISAEQANQIKLQRTSQTGGR